MRIPSHAMPPVACPCCGKVCDRATPVGEDRPPLPGDLTVCLGCAAIMRFDAGLDLEVLAPEALRRLLREDPRTFAMLLRAQHRILAAALERRTR